MSPDPGGLPRYLIKSVIPLAFLLLMLQGIVLAIKQVAILKGVLTEDMHVRRQVDQLREGL